MDDFVLPVDSLGYAESGDHLFHSHGFPHTYAVQKYLGNVKNVTSFSRFASPTLWMPSKYSSLADLGPVAQSHQAEIDEVKSRIGVVHGYYDAWIYGFLENKKFNIEETVAKLHRRFAMELNELGTIEFTDFMRESLRKGIIQDIGYDKLGRTVFFINTCRDFPESKYRHEQRKTFDMFVSYGTRLRADNKRCQLVMLINQEGAGLMKNVDMSFQADVALRISKFYPGGVDKMYVCRMGRTLSAMAKPIFKRLPAIVSERIQIYSDHDIKNNALLDTIDESVLPIAFGGTNDCDNEAHWTAYAERIEAYFAELKQALNERGLTVKEFELEKLGIDPKTGEPLSGAAGGRSGAGEASANKSFVQSRQASVGHRHQATEGGDNISFQDSTLQTCQSLLDPYEDAYDDEGVMDDGSPSEKRRTWAELIQDLPESLAFFFLEELLRWRTNVEEAEAAEWYRMVATYVEERHRVSQRTRGFDVNDNVWYRGIPAPLRSLANMILSGVTVLNALYVMAALVFVAVFCGDIVVTIFFGFFVKPSFFFPLHCVMVMSMIQGASLCTRAVDFLLAIYEGSVIPLFERFGSNVGTILELTYFSVLVAVQLIIFCIYAARDSPLRGLQVSFATGWLSSLFSIALTHVFFFTGIFTASNRPSSENRLATLPFFLALNFGGDSSSTVDMSAIVALRTSSYIICGVPLTLSMLIGIGFLISRVVALYASVIVVSVVAAFAVNYYSEALSNSLSASFTRLTLWMMTIAWLYVTFAFGFSNYSEPWVSSVIVASVLHGLFTILSLLCLKLSGGSWLLRVSFSMVILYLIACWIASFPLVGFKIGLFCLAMMVHNCVNIVFAPKDLTNITGVFFVSAAVVLLALSCVLLGWYGTASQYRDPMGLPSVAPGVQLSMLDLFHRYPVCALRVGDDESLTIVDFALLAELVMAQTPALLATDMNTWFAGRGIEYDGVTLRVEADGMEWDVHQFNALSAGKTILVVVNRYAASSIVAMSLWLDSMALSPLGIFLPLNWGSTIVLVMSFVSRMIPFKYADLVTTLAEFFAEKNATSSNGVIMVGSGVAGGVASVAAVHAEVPAFVFSAPGLLHVERKFEFDFAAYHRYVLNTGAYYGVLDNVGGQDPLLKQKILCDNKPLECISPHYIGALLVQACEDEQGRQHRQI